MSKFSNIANIYDHGKLRKINCVFIQRVARYISSTSSQQNVSKSAPFVKLFVISSYAFFAFFNRTAIRKSFTSPSSPCLPPPSPPPQCDEANNSREVLD